MQNLCELKKIGFENADNLIDITKLQIDTDLPVQQRLCNFLLKIQNPYLYKHGKTVVKISFAQTDVTLDDRLKSYFAAL